MPRKKIARKVGKTLKKKYSLGLAKGAFSRSRKVVKKASKNRSKGLGTGIAVGFGATAVGGGTAYAVGRRKKKRR